MAHQNVTVSPDRIPAEMRRPRDRSASSGTWTTVESSNRGVERGNMRWTSALRSAVRFVKRALNPWPF